MSHLPGISIATCCAALFVLLDGYDAQKHAELISCCKFRNLQLEYIAEQRHSGHRNHRITRKEIVCVSSDAFTYVETNHGAFFSRFLMYDDSFLNHALLICQVEHRTLQGAFRLIGNRKFDTVGIPECESPHCRDICVQFHKQSSNLFSFFSFLLYTDRGLPVRAITFRDSARMMNRFGKANKVSMDGDHPLPHL